MKTNATGRGGHLQLVGSETMSPAAWSGAEALAHANRLYNLGRRLTGNDADAEELVQETLCPGARRRANVHGREPQGVAVQDPAQHVRRPAAPRRAVPVPGIDNLADAATGDDVELLRDDLELERLRRLVGQEIEAALAALSDEARTIVLLDVEGFSESEVADVLGCPVGTVKSRLSRARALLRQRLRDYAR